MPCVQGAHVSSDRVGELKYFVLHPQSMHVFLSMMKYDIQHDNHELTYVICCFVEADCLPITVPYQKSIFFTFSESE